MGLHFIAYTDKVILLDLKPDITVIDKLDDQVTVIDGIAPPDRRIADKENEDLRIEIEQLWDKKTRVVSL